MTCPRPCRGEAAAVTDARPGVRRAAPFLAAALAACLAGPTACWTSHADWSDGGLPREDGDTEDAAPDDARPDADADADADADGEAGGRVVWTPDEPDPGRDVVWLDAEESGPGGVRVRLRVRSGVGVFGVAARIRFDPRVVRPSPSACRAGEVFGPGAHFQAEERDSAEVPGMAELWVGVARSDPPAFVEADDGVDAAVLGFHILGTGVTALELLPGRSAAMAAPPTRYATRRAVGGRLEVVR